jgi:hypothetical protein
MEVFLLTLGNHAGLHDSQRYYKNRTLHTALPTRVSTAWLMLFRRFFGW